MAIIDILKQGCLYLQADNNSTDIHLNLEMITALRH
jgi:hypothetical protein